jgi:hypothetical protein
MQYLLLCFWLSVYSEITFHLRLLKYICLLWTCLTRKELSGSEILCRAHQVQEETAQEVSVLSLLSSLPSCAEGGRRPHLCLWYPRHAEICKYAISPPGWHRTAAPEGDLTQVEPYLRLGRVPKICLEVTYYEFRMFFYGRKIIKCRGRFSGNSSLFKWHITNLLKGTTLVSDTPQMSCMSLFQ